MKKTGLLSQCLPFNDIVIFTTISSMFDSVYYPKALSQPSDNSDWFIPLLTLGIKSLFVELICLMPLQSPPTLWLSWPAGVPGSPQLGQSVGKNHTFSACDFRVPVSVCIDEVLLFLLVYEGNTVHKDHQLIQDCVSQVGNCCAR